MTTLQFTVTDLFRVAISRNSFSSAQQFVYFCNLSSFRVVVIVVFPRFSSSFRALFLGWVFWTQKRTKSIFGSRSFSRSLSRSCSLPFAPCARALQIDFHFWRLSKKKAIQNNNKRTTQEFSLVPLLAASLLFCCFIGSCREQVYFLLFRFLFPSFPFPTLLPYVFLLLEMLTNTVAHTRTHTHTHRPNNKNSFAVFGLIFVVVFFFVFGFTLLLQRPVYVFVFALHFARFLFFGFVSCSKQFGF